MIKKTAFLMILIIVFESLAVLGVDSKGAAYVGGTFPAFQGLKEFVEGELQTQDEKILKFVYGKKKEVMPIAYSSIIDLEYGQKAGRRVGAAAATAILISPIGLVALFSKKRKHFLTIGYRDEEGKEQVAVFELGKDTVRTTLAIVKTRSGKELIYQDDEARKHGA